MRLHNRQLKASFFNDPDLLQWPRDKRFFYAGLIQIADDSACLEDSSFSFKLLIFPSPKDADITIEQLSIWRDEFIAEKKLVSYISEGKKCLYLSNFHKHQKLKSPSPPTVPLPEWVAWIPTKSNQNAGKYIINKDMFKSILHSSYDVLISDLISSCDVLTNDLQKSYDILIEVFQPEPKPEPELKENTDDDDNARAREEMENRQFESLQEESVSPVSEAETTEVEDDAKLAADTPSLPIALESIPTAPKKPVHGLGSRAITFAEINFGRTLLPIERSNIANFCHQFKNRASPDPDAIVIEGITRCVKYNHCDMSYLEGIIINWLDYGVIDLSHIANLDAERPKQKEQNPGSLRTLKNKSQGGNDSAKNLGTSRQRINDSTAYDPSAWVRAGFAVTT
jgi:DnaD/phage-associated family protein